jgi:REP element-mobilizing transposase RayT
VAREDVLAYFITFTCYGTWLHGDARGSTLKRSEGRNLALSPNAQREKYNRDALKRPPVALDRPMRSAVDSAIREACEFRNWRLLALNVRTNHVHVVIEAPPVKGDGVVSALKARATLALRKAGLAEDGAPVWSEGGSCRWLWDERSVEAACRYVTEQQGPDLL